MTTQHSFIDSFNARYLDFEQIARTFISNDQYLELLKNNHSLLMGPRGSGKTTLLKMLTPAGRFYLQGAGQDLPTSTFTAIYIASDVQWKKQMEHFYAQVHISQHHKEVISRFLVTTNILLCLIKTFKYMIEFDFKKTSNFDNQQLLNLEAELCKLLINDFEIDTPISPNLLAVQKILERRITVCNKLINKLRSTFYNENLVDAMPEYYFNDYHSLLSDACTSFEMIFFQGVAHKWALCFDELEISPQWLQFELIDKLRSVDQRFLFKLVTSPIISLVDRIEKEPINASENEDYKIIRTWNYNDSCTSRWNIFARSLTNNKLKQSLGDSTESEKIFGESTYERNLKTSFKIDETIKHTSKYDRGGYYWSVFKELALIDPSFNTFLTRKNISPSNPAPKTKEDKDQILRKILPIVIFRYQFSRSFNILKSSNRRSRKNPALFYGVPFLYEVCDGNPRFLMNLLDQLITNIKTTEKYVLDINKQSAIVNQISNKYLELIKAHPDANRELYKNRLVNLGDLISKIGNYFKDQLLYQEFTMDPVGAFIVDDKMPINIVNLIELGVRLGAIIYLEPDEGISKNGVVGKKLRLCYLLHPIFDFPKREYSSINLSSILYKGKGKQIDSQLLFEL